MLTNKPCFHLLVAIAVIRNLTLSARAAKILNNTIGSVVDYANFSSEPDAYGSVPIPGFNFNKAYPGLWDEPPSLLQRWHLEVRFQTYQIKHSTSTTTYISTQLRPPPIGSEGGVFDPQTGNLSIPVDISDTWTLTLLNFATNGHTLLPEVVEGNNKQNGSCPETVMSQACQDELREAIRTSTTVLNGTSTTSLNSTPILSKCPSCREVPQGWISARVPLDINGRGFNRSTIFYASIHQAEDDTPKAYDRYGLRTFPMIMIWGHGNTTEEINKPLSADHVVIACVKADEFAQGVAKPKGSDAVGHLASLSGGGLWKVLSIVMGTVCSLL